MPRSLMLQISSWKKLKLDQDAAKAKGDDNDSNLENAEGKVLSRNDLLEMIKGNRDQKDKWV